MNFEVGDRVTLSPAFRLQVTNVANGSVLPGEFAEQTVRRGTVRDVHRLTSDVVLEVAVVWDSRSDKPELERAMVYEPWKLTKVSIVDRIGELEPGT